jgi:hypothetical protein
MLPKHSTVFDIMFLTEASEVTSTSISKICTLNPLAFNKAAVSWIPFAFRSASAMALHPARAYASQRWRPIPEPTKSINGRVNHIYDIEERGI